jgi:phage-related protein
MTAKSVSDLASEYAMLTNYSDDSIQSAENMLLTFTGIGKEVFPEATKTVLNMSQALGQDLQASSVQLGKALNDPIAGVTALRKVGVALTDQQRDQIKAFVESGDTLSAQKVILKELAVEFGGAAEAAADPLTILGNQFSELKEGIGLALLPLLSMIANVLAREVIPWLQVGIGHFQTFVDLIGAALRGDLAEAAVLFAALPAPLQQLALWLAENRDEIENVIRVARELAQDVLEGWVRIFKALAPVLADFARYLNEHKPLAIALAVALGVLAAVIIGIPALIVAIIIAGGLLAAHWDTIKAKAIEIWGSLAGPVQDYLKLYYEIVMIYWALIQNYVETAIKVIRDIVVIVMALLKGDWGAAWEGVKQLAADLWNGIVTDIGLKLDIMKLIVAYAMGIIRDVLAFAWAWIKSMIVGVWDALLDKAGDAWESIKDAIVDPINDVIDKIKELIDWINKIPTPGDIVDGAQGMLKSGWDKLPGNARGGGASGWRLVGEEGPELAYFGRGGQVMNNQETRALGGPGVTGGVTVIGPVNILGGLAEGIAAMGGVPALGGAT